MEETFTTYRPLLFSIAYRMLGSATEAEDMVQNTYLRYQAAPQEEIRSHRAFLTTIVTRLCLNHLELARTQRESYVGPWLPEPLPTFTETDTSQQPAARLESLESISMAFLVLLERLTPLERAVFLLREVFDYPYGEIAAMVGSSEGASRQAFSRAKKHIAANRPRFDSSPDQHRAILGRFIGAIEGGDLDGLTQMLAHDAALWADGGGKVTAATRPLFGRDAVAQFVMGSTRFLSDGARYEITEINAAPALVIRVNGRAALVILLEQGGELGVNRPNSTIIQTVRVIANPDKLARLGASPDAGKAIQIQPPITKSPSSGDEGDMQNLNEG